MKRLVAGVAAIALIGSAAYAADSMAALYGNTLISTHPDGAQFKINYMKDHTYTATDTKGAAVKGTWAVADGKLCITETAPDPSKGKQCVPEFPQGKKVGDSWEVTASNGMKETLSIVAGP